MSTPNSSPELVETPLIEDPVKKKHRSSWLILFSMILAGVLLYFSLRNLDWESFWHTIRFGHYGFLFLILPLASINYFIRATRWSIFVRSDKKKISVISVFWANMTGYMGNAFLPARAGEIIRSAFLGKTSGLGTSLVLATALTERILDVIALVIIGSISLLLQKGISPLLMSSVRIMAIIGLIGLVIVIAAPYQEKLILKFTNWLPLPKNITEKISLQIGRFLAGMRCLQSWRRILGFILLTAVIWLMDAFVSTLGARIISESLSISQALILLSALGLSSAIPSTPGYIGVYQFVAVTVLVPFGFSKANALAFILISQLFNYLIVSIWGLIGLLQLKRNKGIDQN